VITPILAQAFEGQLEIQWKQKWQKEQKKQKLPAQ
jgi:hypothetical protein